MSRIAAVSSVMFRVGVLWVLLGACAQGFEGPQSFGFDGPGASQGGGQVGNDNGPGNGAGGSGNATAGAGSGAAGMGGTGSGAFDGEPCTRGEVQACECDNGGMGMRTCAFDAASPTEGSFGVCGRCSGGSSGSSGAGSGGSSGGSGSGGSGGSGSRAGSGGSGGSSGGSGSGGSSGAAGTGSTTPPASGSRPAWCIFVPVPIPGC